MNYGSGAVEELVRVVEGRSYSEVRRVVAPPPHAIFSMSVHLLNRNSAHPCYIADETKVKSYLSENWGRTKSLCRQIGVVHPTKSFL